MFYVLILVWVIGCLIRAYRKKSAVCLGVSSIFISFLLFTISTPQVALLALITGLGLTSLLFVAANSPQTN